MAMKFTPDDVLVFDPYVELRSERSAETDFRANIGPIKDEYRPTREFSFDNRLEGDRNLITVENLRTGNVTSGFWWRLKKKERIYQYDPTQQGDTDDDI